MVYGEDIVCIPHLIGLVGFFNERHLVGAIARVASPIGEPEDPVGTPFASVGTTTDSDQIDAAHAVMFAPDIDIPLDVDAVPVRPRDAVNVGNPTALRIDHDRANVVAKDHAVDAVQPMCPALRQRRQELGVMFRE